MSYSIERRDNPRVYLVTLNEDFEPSSELAQYANELEHAIDSETEPINIIVDMSQYNISFDDLLVATKDTLKMDANPYQHPNARNAILVTKSNLMKMSLDGFIRFGIAKKVKPVNTLDEALRLASGL